MAYQDWKKYESPERWTSYFTQVDEVLSFHPGTCLEIGVGNRIVTQALKTHGIALTTLDIDPALQPDTVGSVERIPSPDQSFDVVLCAEVLEHLPFEKFETCLREIARVSKAGAVLSLPHWGYTIRGILDLPIIKWRWVWKLPIARALPAGGEHQWEIGRTGHSAASVRRVIERVFVIEKEWLSPWNPYHHFYRLRKRSA